MLKKEGKDTAEVMAEMKKLSEEVKELDVKVKDIDAALEDVLMGIPNTPVEGTPEGNTDEDNLEVRTWGGEPTTFDFEPKAHWDVGTELDILDFERGTKIAGTRFTVLKKQWCKA